MTLLEEKIDILKERIKSREPNVQRQAIRSFIPLCQSQNNSNATRIIIKTLYSMIHSDNLTIGTSTIDTILELCRLGYADVDKLTSSLTRFAITIPIQVLPHLTRGLINCLLFKISHASSSSETTTSAAQKQKKKKKKQSRNEHDRMVKQCGQSLVTLAQNRPESIPEIIHQLPLLFYTVPALDQKKKKKQSVDVDDAVSENNNNNNNSNSILKSTIQFVSPFYTHVLTSRQLLSSSSASVVVVGAQTTVGQQSPSSGSPITTTGTTSASMKNQTQNYASNALRYRLIHDTVRVALQLYRARNRFDFCFAIISHLFHYVPCFSIDASDVDTSCIAPCREILDALLIMSNDNNENNLKHQYAISQMICMLFRHMLSLLDDIKRLKIDNEPCFTEIVRMLELEPGYLIQFTPIICLQMNSAVTELELNAYTSILFKIVEYVTSDTEDFYQFYTGCGSKLHIIQECSFYTLYISTVLMCAASFMSVLSTASTPIQQMANESLNLMKGILSLENALEQKQYWTDRQQKEYVEHESDALSSHLSDIDPLFTRGVVSILRPHYVLIDHFFDSEHELLNVNFVSNWLRGLSSNIKSNISRDEAKPIIESVDNMCVILGLIFIASRTMCHTESGTKTRSQACETIKHICQTLDPVRCGLFFQPLFLFELSRENNADARLDLISTLPKLGTRSFVCVTPIVRVLNSLMTEPSLVPIVLRQLTNLWKENDRFFGKLKTTLLEKSEYHSDTTFIDIQRLNKFDLEVRISLASCIRDICEHQPKKGLELLSLISRILCQDNNPTVLGFGLQALYYLCAGDQVDFNIVWFKLIASNIIQQSARHTSVLQHMCKLLRFGIRSESVDFDNAKTIEEEDKIKLAREEDEYNLFLDFDSENKEDVKQLMIMLWSYTDHTSELVREAAFESLAEYPLRAHLYVLKKEEPASQEDDREEKKEEGLFAQQEIRKQILLEFGSIIMQKLSVDTSQVVRSQIKKLVNMILKAELRTPQGLRKVSATAPSLSTNTVLDVITNLRLFLSNDLSKRATIDQNTIAAKLWNPIVAPSHKSTADQYKRVLAEMIADINIGASVEDYYAHFLLVEGFSTLVNRYYQALVAEEEQDKSKNQKPYDSAFDSIFNYLKGIINNSTIPTRTENAILALAGLCLSLPSHAHQNVEKVVTLLKELIASEPQEWVLFACNMTLAAASYELHVPAQITSIVDILLGQIDTLTDDEFASINSLSSSIALGLIIKGMCMNEGVMTNGVDEFERNLVLRVSARLFDLCFAKPLPLKTKSADASESITSSIDYDWKQLNNNLLGLSLCTGALARIAEFDAIRAVYTEVVDRVRMTLDLTSSNMQPSALLVLPQVVLTMYSTHMISWSEITEIIDIYQTLVNKTETKGLPALVKLYSYAYIGLSNLLFNLFCQSGIDSDEHHSEIRQLYEVQFEKLIETVDNNQSANIGARISSICSISVMLGVNLFVAPQLSQSTLADHLGLSEQTNKQYEIAFSSPQHRNWFSSAIQNEDQRSSLYQSIQKSVASLKRIYLDKTTIDTRLRKFSAYLVASLSELYSVDNDEASDPDSENRIPLQYLSESGLSFFFIRLLTDVHLELRELKNLSENTSVLNVQIALEGFLSNNSLPKILWSRIVQNLLRALSGHHNNMISEHNIRIELRKLCFRMLCKDAQSASSKSASLKMLSSICEKVHFQALETDLQKEICENLFATLISLFPSIRGCSFLSDLCALSFISSAHFPYILTAFKHLKEGHCADQALVSHVKALLPKIKEEVEKIVINQPTPLISVVQQKATDSDELKQAYSINAESVRTINELAECISRMPKVLTRDFYGGIQTTVDLMLHTLISLNDQKQNCENISVGMKPVRQVCMKSDTNEFTSKIFSALLGEIVCSYTTQSSCAQWLRETIDMISFVLVEQLSPLQQALILTAPSHNKQSQKHADLHFENALEFLAHMSMCANIRDLYAIYFSSNQSIARCLVSSTTNVLMDLHETKSLLVHALSNAFHYSKLDATVEKSLLSRIYALLNSNDTQAATFSFIIPLLISIQSKKHVGWSSFQQIGHALEKKSFKLINHIL